MVRRMPLVALVIAITVALGASCVDEVSIPVMPGMSESDVERLYGEPSYVVEDKERFERFVNRQCDVQRLVRVLVYDYLIWPLARRSGRSQR
jgi:hypothetical protein